jgi:cell division protein FtsL
MNKKQKIEAHDILSDDEFTEEYFSDNTKKTEKSDEKEIRKARIIFDFLNARKRGSWPVEREQTKKRLEKSIQKAETGKYLLKWVAAVFLLLAIFSVLLIRNNLKTETAIVDFAQTIDPTKSDSVTNLILQDGRKVLITEEESQIVYDEKGMNIVIDSSQKVSQEVKQKKEVFNTLVVPYGKRAQISLAGGSKVWLNSGSKLIYPATYLKGKREVYLEGEAIFEVAHSAQIPFIVRTKDFDIKVMGTVFNVSSYPEDNVSSTVLEKGKIELSPNERSFLRKEKLTILPGHMVTFNPVRKTFQEQQVDTEYYFSWRDGYIICKGEPLGSILRKLERYYNVSIKLQNAEFKSETFSGYLDLKNTPDEVLKVIAETTPFSLKYENKNFNH